MEAERRLEDCKEDDRLEIKKLSFTVDFLRKRLEEDQQKREECVDLLVQRSELLDEIERLKKENEELTRANMVLVDAFPVDLANHGKAAATARTL